MLSWAASTLCCNADIDGLRLAGLDSKRLAEETSEICVSARAKGETEVATTRGIQDTLQGFGDKIDASTFVKIKELLDGDRASQTLALASEMDEMASKCIVKSKEMTEAMTRGVESLPDPVKDELEENFETDDDEEMTELLEVDKDIEELELCTRSIESMNIFTAARSGRDAFAGLATKEVLCQKIFDKIRELSETVARISEALTMGNCCAQVKAIASQVNSMFRSIHLSKLITAAAEALRRLTGAIINLVKTACNKFRGFMSEFDAAKKLGRFVNGLNPMNSAAGQAATSVFGSVMSSIGLG